MNKGHIIYRKNSIKDRYTVLIKVLSSKNSAFIFIHHKFLSLLTGSFPSTYNFHPDRPPLLYSSLQQNSTGGLYSFVLIPLLSFFLEINQIDLLPLDSSKITKITSIKVTSGFYFAKSELNSQALPQLIISIIWQTEHLLPLGNVLFTRLPGPGIFVFLLFHQDFFLCLLCGFSIIFLTSET